MQEQSKVIVYHVSSLRSEPGMFCAEKYHRHTQLKPYSGPGIIFHELLTYLMYKHPAN